MFYFVLLPLILLLLAYKFLSSKTHHFNLPRQPLSRPVVNHCPPKSTDQSSPSVLARVVVYLLLPSPKNILHRPKTTLFSQPDPPTHRQPHRL
ncbi:predicted protein [Arabidopsis lyrata subsp. lyrata]|uniref:Predicted protein n=1 Tax=Arabidopsis lyrata subsp. lyrata TaxID=81972 RepID=D7MI80_ARALL|nr:predicted protein [Arabidopsis lyrata subsp. lyrata]